MMKKLVCMFMIAGAVLAMPACAGEEEQEPIAVASFSKSDAPAQIVRTENNWVYLLNQYGSAEYQIAVGNTATDLESVYQVENVSIQNMEANDNYVVWCEKSAQYYEYKVYSMTDRTVETIYKGVVDGGTQLSTVALYNNQVFYSYIDYGTKNAGIISYDMDTKTGTTIYSPEYQDAFSIMSFAVDGKYLSVAGGGKIVVKDLETSETVYRCAIPKGVEYVFSVSYDYDNKKCALYYVDADSEDIGVISEDKTKVDSHYTFAANHYAYHDMIKCQKGHIYWIIKAEVTGTVAEHYIYVDYDYLNKEPVETAYTMDVYVDETNEYYLSYDKASDYKKSLVYGK